MTTITIDMTVRPEKSRELLITLHELVEEMKKVHGFLDAHIHHESMHPNKVTFIEYWDTQEDVDAYLMSDYFAILRGAMKVLTISHEITFSSSPDQNAAVPEDTEY